MLKPCIVCGELSEQSRCPDHKPAPRAGRRTDTSTASWKRLAKRAKRMQPFCLFCGATSDLQLDHKAEAWHAITNGKAVTLAMVQVTCRRCNVQLGSSQPGSTRYRHWEATGDDLSTLGGRGDPTPLHVRGKPQGALHMGTVLKSGEVAR